MVWSESPDSFKLDEVSIVCKEGAYGSALVTFRAKNGFSGVTRDSALCIAYDDEGTRMIKAELN